VPSEDRRDPSQERRQKEGHPRDRLNGDIISKLGEKDKDWLVKPRAGFNHLYELLNHNVNVSTVAVAIAEEQKLSDEEIALSCSGGLGHDLGKLVEPYNSLYRADRILEDYERVVMKGHSDASGKIVLRYLPRVRPEDRQFIKDVSLLARCTHDPWLLAEENSRLLQVGWNLHNADKFVAMTEDRYVGHPGMSPPDAVQRLRSIVEKQVVEKAEFAKENKRSFQSIDKLWGPKAFEAYP